MKKLMICIFAILLSAVVRAQSVTTVERMIVGSDAIYGRITLSNVADGDAVAMVFCYSSTTTSPTTGDLLSDRVIGHHGNIYVMEHLTPATRYYIRGYARLKDGSVIYGQPLKVYTLPRGSVTYGIRDDSPTDFVNRVKPELERAVSYYNRFTSIQGYYVNVGFGADIPTADCSYGGWMRIGPNQDYQRVGTILHEMAHGIGVGTQDMWWNANLRADGNSGRWLGERATEIVRFLDNDGGASLWGDTQHMWPYGINGNWEDTGEEMLYVGNVSICQALGEDGLPPTSGFATPAYTLSYDDNQKYYIKSESSEFGLEDSYLYEKEDGKVVWTIVDSPFTDDHAAWYPEYDPQTQYYQLVNAATGHRLVYARHTFSCTDTTEGQTLQLMRSRTDVSTTVKHRSYWMVMPSKSSAPSCVAPRAGGQLTTQAYDMANTAVSQRWLVLSEAEARRLEKTFVASTKSNLRSFLADLRKLLKVPHTNAGSNADADEAFEQYISQIESQSQDDDMSVGRLSSLLTQAREAAVDFLGQAIATDEGKPFNLTFLVKNASMKSVDGWSTDTRCENNCAEFFQKTFTFTQDLTAMPVGNYELRVNAFQRTSSIDTAYKNHQAGTETITAYLLLGKEQTPLCGILDGASEKSVVSGNISVGSPAVYVPNDMYSSRRFFLLGNYLNTLKSKLTASNGSPTTTLRIGISCNRAPSNSWVIFSNFQLFYYGGGSELGIVTPEKTASGAQRYNLQGQQVGEDYRGVVVVEGRKHVGK
ncbi:MAG: hypothetical protein IJ196_02370 [Prevotella sp.]|nr:hypothetical protein [Prevotella sp.]